MSRLTEFRDGIWRLSVDAVREGYDRYSVFSRLAAYENAEEAGLLIRLPCKVGDTVYENRMGEVEVAYGYTQPQFDTFSKRFCLSDFHRIGKTVFLARALAEEALAKEARHE